MQLTDAEIEACVSDTLPDDLARSLADAYGIPAHIMDDAVSIRQIAQAILIRLRAGGISDVTLRQVLVTDPDNARDYYQRLSAFTRDMEAYRGDPKRYRALQLERCTLMLRFNGRYGKAKR